MSTVYGLTLTPGTTNIGWVLHLFPTQPATSQETIPKGYDAKETGAMLGCPASTVRQYWHDGILDYYWAGRRMCSTLDQIRKFQLAGGGRPVTTPTKTRRRRK